MNLREESRKGKTGSKIKQKMYLRIKKLKFRMPGQAGGWDLAETHKHLQ